MALTLTPQLLELLRDISYHDDGQSLQLEEKYKPLIPLLMDILNIEESRLNYEDMILELQLGIIAITNRMKIYSDTQGQYISAIEELFNDAELKLFFADMEELIKDKEPTE